jgi:hypothetical protein
MRTQWLPISTDKDRDGAGAIVGRGFPTTRRSTKLDPMRMLRRPGSLA